jgi:hypothetical protein
MAEPLRPLSTGELLDRAFSLYRRNFILFAGIAAPAPAIYLACQVLLALTINTPVATGKAAGPGALFANMPAFLASFFVMAIAYLIGFAITQAAGIHAVSAVHLSHPTSIGECYRKLRGRFATIIGVFLSVSIRVFGGSFLLMMIAFVIMAFGIGGGSVLGTGGAIVGGIVGTIAIVAAALLAITLFVRYSLAVQACVAENLKVRASIKRSVFLSKGSRSRILTVYSLFLVINWIAGFAILFLAGLVTVKLGPGMAANAIVYAAGFVSGVLVGPLPTIAMSLVYYDERVRKEAFDLQLMMSALEPPPAASAATAG